MKSLTPKIKQILDTPDSQVDIAEAATVLLQVNRNRVLHQNIIRRNDVEKLKYELRKIYDFRIQNETIAETKKLETEVAVVLKETFPKAEQKEASELKGMRADHEQLPEVIKAKYLENVNIFPRMRKLHEQLKLMNIGKPCDRYPFLKELKALDIQLRANWDAYDAYVIPPVDSNAGKSSEESGTTTTETTTTPAEVSSKDISAARKYISTNKTKLGKLKETDPEKHATLIKEMQTRLDLLIATNSGISEQQLGELKELGLKA